MLVFGLISPHPPLIIPEIGGEDIKQVRRTIEALKHAMRSLAEARPEKLILISPHEDHGFEVPEYYLREALSDDTPVEEILVTETSYEYYYRYGQELGGIIHREPTRYAIVASGDLSHVLKADGPYGFNAAGAVLDQQIIEAVRCRDASALLTIDPAVLNDGAECGLRSILFLLGAFESVEAAAQVQSYEGPFGVGYMVATVVPEASAHAAVTALARQAIAHYLETGKVLDAPKNIPTHLAQPAAAFVSLHEKDGGLRGCIGTIRPAKDNLAAEVIANAISAAVHDPRFQAVDASELSKLEISVDVLSAPVAEPDISKLDPKQYGVVVSASGGRQGVLLPNLDGVDTATEQIEICREKGGISANEPVKVSKFQVRRYSES